MLAFSADEVSFAEAAGNVALSELLRSRLAQVQSSQNAFLGQIVHQFRTPLHGLQSSIELAREALSQGESNCAKEMMASAEQATQALTRLFENAQQVVSLTEDELPPAQHACDLAAVLKDAISDAILQQDQLSPSVRVFLCLGRGACDKAVVDRAAFSRVAGQLVDNALKFTSNGSVVISLAVSNGVADLHVRDTGVGMSSDYLDRQHHRIFENESAFSPGLGVGAYVAAELVKRMGGTIEVASQLGESTDVHVSFPAPLQEDAPSASAPVDYNFGICKSGQPMVTYSAVDAADAFSQLSLASRTPSPQPQPLTTFQSLDGGFRVLVVDDNIVARRVLTMLLTRMGIDHAEAVDGLDALRVFMRYAPHCVLTDLSMPGLDGLQSAEQMRNHEKAEGWRRSHIAIISAQPAPAKLSETVDKWFVEGQADPRRIRAHVASVQDAARQVQLSATSSIAVDLIVESVQKSV